MTSVRESSVLTDGLAGIHNRPLVVVGSSD